MKKATKIKTVAILINVLAPLIVTATQLPMIVSRPDTRWSFAAVLLLILGFVFLKDQIRKHLLSPSTLSLSIFFVFVGYAGNALGDQFLLIGMTTIAASLVAAPFYMWYKYEKRDDERLKRINELKEIIGDNEHN